MVPIALLVLEQDPFIQRLKGLYRVRSAETELPESGATEGTWRSAVRRIRGVLWLLAAALNTQAGTFQGERLRSDLRLTLLAEKITPVTEWVRRQCLCIGMNRFEDHACDGMDPKIYGETSNLLASKIHQQ